MATDIILEAQVTKNMTIPQLINYLKTCFIKRHYEKVQDILVQRESQLTNENNLLSEKLALEELQVASLERKLSKQRSDMGKEIEAWKTKFRELARRFEKLEGAFSGRAGGGGSGEGVAGISGKVIEEVALEEPGGGAVGKTEAGAVGKKEAGAVGKTVDGAVGKTVAGAMGKAEFKAVNGEATAILTKDNGATAVASDTPCVTTSNPQNPRNWGCSKFANVDTIAIDDSDDEDCASVRDFSGHKWASQEGQKNPHLQLLNAVKETLLKRKRESVSSSSSEDTSSSSDTEYDSQKKLSKPWKSEIDMFLAVQKNVELTMKAVCALYKKHMLSEKSVGGAFSSQTRGFQEKYAHRGKILGKYLTNGNLDGKLTKSVQELRIYDPNAIDECKKIATEHYKQLFEIYMKNEYNFFP